MSHRLPSGLYPCVVACLAVVLPGYASQAAAQPVSPAPPEHLSWYGDRSAPDISGVWKLAEPGNAGDPAGSKEGWRPWPPPLKSPFDAAWAKRVAAAAAGTRVDDPVRGCLPPGMPRFITGATGALLIIQTPGRVTLYRDGDPVRRVWLDGRSQPKPASLESFSNGNAVGRYDGSDLVTDVIGIKDEPIDATGVPHSDDLRITERYHRVDQKTLRVELTLTDPTAYREPMRATVTYAAVDDPLWEPHEFICTPKTNYHPDAYIR